MPRQAICGFRLFFLCVLYSFVVGWSVTKCNEYSFHRTRNYFFHSLFFVHTLPWRYRILRGPWEGFKRGRTLSLFLHAAQGVTGKTYEQLLRTVPSAGALYPFEIYVIANNVQDVDKGIYHYDVPDHALELIKYGDFRKKITNAGLKQEMLGDAGVTFVLAAVFDRTRHKYGERGYRYVYIEAGHISQNIYLQAVSLGLGSVAVGAFIDKEVNELIGIDGQKEAAIYLHAVGAL